LAGKKQQKLGELSQDTCGLLPLSNRPVVGLCLCKSGPQHGWTKMIATRVTQTYASLFLTSKQDDGSRHAAIVSIGAFEVRLLELPSVNSAEDLELWVELYDRNLQVSVDSYKCSDLDEAIDAAQFLTAQASQQSRAESPPSSFERLQANL
jgi:hypothetical protein